MRMKPNRIEDLIAANALFRPGPMEYIPDYVARKHGAIWKTPHPIMTDVLRDLRNHGLSGAGIAHRQSTRRRGA